MLFDSKTKEFVMSISDYAPEFIQLKVNNPIAGGDPKKQRIGGLGLIIVKRSWMNILTNVRTAKLSCY